MDAAYWISCVSASEHFRSIRSDLLMKFEDKEALVSVLGSFYELYSMCDMLALIM